MVLDEQRRPLLRLLRFRTGRAAFRWLLARDAALFHLSRVAVDAADPLAQAHQSASRSADTVFADPVRRHDVRAGGVRIGAAELCAAAAVPDRITGRACSVGTQREIRSRMGLD